MVIVYDPVGVVATVLIVKLVVCGELPAPVVTRGFVANAALAPLGSPEAASVTSHWLLFPPTASDTVYPAGDPCAVVTLPGVTVIVPGFESVKIHVAVPEEAPVAVTEYCATNQSGRLN